MKRSRGGSRTAPTFLLWSCPFRVDERGANVVSGVCAGRVTACGRLREEFEDGDSDADYGYDYAGDADGDAEFDSLHLGTQIGDVFFHRVDVFLDGVDIFFGCDTLEVCRSDDIAINRFAESFDDGLGLGFVEACVLQFFDDSVGVESDGCHVIERLSQGVRSILIYVHRGVCVPHVPAAPLDSCLRRNDGEGAQE